MKRPWWEENLAHSRTKCIFLWKKLTLWCKFEGPLPGNCYLRDFGTCEELESMRYHLGVSAGRSRTLQLYTYVGAEREEAVVGRKVSSLSNEMHFWVGKVNFMV